MIDIYVRVDIDVSGKKPAGGPEDRCFEPPLLKLIEVKSKAMVLNGFRLELK